MKKPSSCLRSICNRGRHIRFTRPRGGCPRHAQIRSSCQLAMDVGCHPPREVAEQLVQLVLLIPAAGRDRRHQSAQYVADAFGGSRSGHPQKPDWKMYASGTSQQQPAPDQSPHSAESPSSSRKNIEAHAQGVVAVVDR